LQKASRGFCDDSEDCISSYGYGKAIIDGTIDGVIAVEVESRTPKQIRGAVLDLLLHQYKKKLLLLVRTQEYDVETMEHQVKYITDQLERGKITVVPIQGSGKHPIKYFNSDVSKVKAAIKAIHT
jgi:hypothetical protein